MKKSRRDLLKAGAGLGVGTFLGTSSGGSTGGAHSESPPQCEHLWPDWLSDIPPSLRKHAWVFASVIEELSAEEAQAEAFLRDPDGWLSSRGIGIGAIELGEYEKRFLLAIASKEIRRALTSGDLQPVAETLAEAHVVPLDVPSSFVSVASANLTAEQKKAVIDAVGEILGMPEPALCGPNVCAVAVAIALVWSVVTLFSQAAAVVVALAIVSEKYVTQLGPSYAPEWAAVVRLLQQMGKGDRATELAVRLCGAYARQVRDVAVRLAPEVADKEPAILRTAAGWFLRFLTGLPPSDQMIAAALAGAS